MARRNFPGRPSHKNKREILKFYGQDDNTIIENRNRNIERNWTHFYEVFGSSDDEDEFEGFHSSTFHRKVFSKYKSENKAVCNSKKKFDYLSVESEIRRNKLGMRSLARKSYDKMIKDGLSGLWKSENILNNNIIFNETKKPLKDNAVSSDKIQDNSRSINKKELQSHKESSNFYFQCNQQKCSGESASKTLIKNQIEKTKTNKNLQEENEDSLLKIKPENNSEKIIMRNNEINKKDNILPVKKKRYSFPDISVRSSQRITQRKRVLEECDKNTIIKKETFDDPSKENQISSLPSPKPVSNKKSITKHKPRYISYEWVPVRSLGTLEQPLVVDGKRKWKPSLKVQTNCDPHKTRRKKYNRLSVKVKKQSLRFSSLYSRGIRKRRKHKSPWGLKRYNKSDKKGQIFDTKFHKNFLCETNEKSTKTSSVVNSDSKKTSSNNYDKIDSNFQQDQISFKHEILKEENNSEELNNLLWKEGQTTGTVICAVCKQIKFYVHMKRRYGQFCCDACSKFFTWFLRKPEQFYCTSNGCCDFSPVHSVEKGLSSSQFCKACWIKVCLEKFIVPIYTRKKLADFMPKFQQNTLPPSVFSDKEVKSTESSQVAQSDLKISNNLLQNSFDKLSSNIKKEIEEKPIKQSTCNFEFEDSTDIEIELDESLISELEKICDETTNKINLSDNETEVEKLPLTFNDKLDECLNEKLSVNIDNRNSSENENSHKLNLSDIETFNKEILIKETKLQSENATSIDASDKMVSSELFHLFANEKKDSQNSLLVIDEKSENEQFSLNPITETTKTQNIEEKSSNDLDSVLYKQKPEEDIIPSVVTKLNDNITSEHKKSQLLFRRKHYRSLKRKDSSKSSLSVSKTLLNRKSLKKRDESDVTFTKLRKNLEVNDELKIADDENYMPEIEVQTKKGPRIKHVCRRASVVFGYPIAAFEKSLKDDDFNLSALPKEEKQKILENDANSPDVDDLPLDELIRRASEKDTKDVIIIRKSEKLDTPNKSPNNQIKNGLRSSISKENNVRFRKVRCKCCEGCKAVDCEKCVFCLDKKKFGGSNLMRKACINRRCRRPQMPSYPHRSIELKKRQLLNESNQGISEMKGAIIYNSSELNDNYITVESSNDRKTEMLQKQKEYKAWKKSSAAKTCLVFVNYWEEYDPDRLLNQGFPLISSEMLAVKYVCYLCGSAGLDDQFQFIFCSLCCEPFHSFCLDEETFNDRFNEETWCCERCQSCIVCGLKENLLKCKVCIKYYHLDCIGPDYPSKPSKKNIWVCPTCMKCKSCSGTIQKGSFWNFDLPYCSKCSLRKTKGSYCPICQQNYDDNDYESKMMQCAKCHLWVHAKCDEITDDMYEILSCLPESVVYTCPCCAQEVECMWLNAVFDELNRGLKSILSAFVNAEIINNSINHQEDIGPQLEYPKFPDLFQRKHCEIRLPPGLHNNTDGKTDNLVDILNKLEKKEYTTLTNFYEEVLALPQLNNVSRPHKVDKLNKLIKLYFPWFEHSHWDKHLSDSSNCHVVNPPYDDHNYAIHNISSVLKESLIQPGKLRDGKNDPRKCVLCGISGDALPIECGRLIYCGQNDWVHVNCALWSAEVFEEIDGSLQNVHPAISRGRSMRCESCNNKGATVGCCIRGCPANYHFKCARDEKAIFQEDKKVYCANHSSRVDEKQVSDDSFFVKHSMYVDQDQLSPKWRKKTWQSGLPAGCVHITIGSLTIENLGYLTPASDRADALVPVDFIATRLFWSTKNPRQRITYRIRTIEVIPETEKVEKVISRHHTIAHNIDKSSLNKIDKRNKTTNFWKFRGSNLKRNNSHSDYKLESLETQVDQKKKIMDQNSESSLLLKNVILDSNQENNSVEDLSDNISAIIDKPTRILNSSEKEENLFHNSVSKKNLNPNQSFLSDTKQLDLKFQKLPLSENKLISPPKIKDFQSEKKEIDNITSEKNDTTKSDSNIYSSKNEISNERNWNKPEENEISNSEQLESINKINNQILESKINNKCKNVVESKNENNIYNSDDPQLPLEEVENICPKLPERKCSIKKKILKTYPLRSRRYQESVKLLKHYTEKNQITINSKKKLKQKKYKEISFPSTNISEMCDDNNNEAEIQVENVNKSRQLRRTPARLYFEHLTKHKLLFKRKKNLNNIFNKKSNCTNHKKNKINCSKNSEFLTNSKNHLYQMPIDFAVQKNNNLNNLVNNEIVVAVGEIENFSYCVDSKETEIQSNERFTDCKKDFSNDETFKCKNCKRQYRTQDSCRKHEINCNFIVDSSSTDEEDVDMISKSQEEKANMNNENKCYLNTVEMDDDDDNDNDDDGDDDDKQSISSMDSAPLSEVCSGYNNNISEQFTYPNSSTSSEIHSENSFQQNIANFNLENNKKKESNQKFILPKPNINVVNSYTSTVSESMFNITENSMLVFNQPDETTPNLNTPYIISNQADMNTARPVCIQNTCQLFTAGLNIVQNPNLSYLGSITISNQELVSMAFNVQDSPLQIQSGIIMDQVQTSQIASNVQLPIMNFPVINPSLPNPQTFVSHPTIMNSQQPFMYLNPVLTQTQVSESVFIMNSESSQPVLYGMPGNTVTQSPLQTSGFIANTNNFNSTNLEQSWLTNSSPNNNVHSSVDMTSTSQNFIEDFSDNSEGLLQKNISTETDSTNEDKFVSNGELLNTVSKINLKRSVSPKNSEKSKNVQSSKCNSTLSELQKLTSNKPLIEVIQKAAQQMLKLTYKSYSDNNQKDNTEEARKSEKPSSTMKSCTSHPRTKYKTARIRRNSTSSENDFSTSNVTSGKTSRRSSVQDDVNENMSLKNSEEKNHPSNKPYIMFEISNEDGLCIKSPNIDEAWKNVLDQVQDACTAAHVKRKNISQNGVDGLSVMGLTNNAVRYILEQLPGAKNCVNYNFLFHPPHPEEEELPLNPTGSARSEPFLSRKDYDMFNFLASKHRCPPQYQPYLRDEEMKHKSSRRATSIDLPMAMRFRHLKNSAKEAVGVYRSQIHGRGLFCKRNIDAGEMIIEYAGEVIRSILTDSREAYYESKGIGCYMFRIDDNEVVDATMHGNAARFINHSCEPNCYSKVINVDGKKHIVIFALKRILKGEELTYNYKFPIEDEKIPCTCGSKRCRKYLN